MIMVRCMATAASAPGESKSRILFNHRELAVFGRKVFEELGLPPDDADLVANCLVHSNLRNQDGHGVSRIPIYAKRLRLGLVNPKPNISVTRSLSQHNPQVLQSAAEVDGDNGMGFVVATRAMKEAISLAKECGIGLVAVRNSTHFGASAHYVLQAIEEDMISLVLTNSSPAQPPWGGARALLGASPFAFGAPAGKRAPFVLDMSTTVMARGKMRLAAERGEPIPSGIGLDRNGRPTTDGMEAFHGVTLPFGGPKGSAITVLIEILAGVLSGSAYVGGVPVSSLYNDFTQRQNVGHFIMALRPDLFMPLEEFKNRMDALVSVLKSEPLAEGFSEILLAGEPEETAERERRKAGVPLQRSVVEELLVLAEELDVDFPRGIPAPNSLDHQCGPSCRH